MAASDMAMVRLAEDMPPPLPLELCFLAADARALARCGNGGPFATLALMPVFANLCSEFRSILPAGIPLVDSDEGFLRYIEECRLRWKLSQDRDLEPIAVAGRLLDFWDGECKKMLPPDGLLGRLAWEHVLDRHDIGCGFLGDDLVWCTPLTAWDTNAPIDYAIDPFGVAATKARGIQMGRVARAILLGLGLEIPTGRWGPMEEFGTDVVGDIRGERLMLAIPTDNPAAAVSVVSAIVRANAVGAMGRGADCQDEADELFWLKTRLTACLHIAQSLHSMVPYLDDCQAKGELEGILKISGFSRGKARCELRNLFTHYRLRPGDREALGYSSTVGNAVSRIAGGRKALFIDSESVEALEVLSAWARPLFRKPGFWQRQRDHGW